MIATILAAVLGGSLARRLKTSSGNPCSAAKRSERSGYRGNIAKLNRGAYLKDFSEDMKNFNVAMGWEGLRRAVEDILRTFLGRHIEIEEQIARGDSVLVRLTVSGTHRSIGQLPKILGFLRSL